MYNPYIRGWINYYSHFYRFGTILDHAPIDGFLIRWARNKYKRLRPRLKGAREWLARVVRADPKSLRPLALSACQLLNIGSRINREVHVRF